MEYENNDFVVNPEEHMKLVWYVTKKFYTTKIVHCEIEDLFQIGCLGLVKAAKLFDPDRGYQFATFAVRVITNEIRMWLRKERRMQSGEVLTLHSPLRENNTPDERLLLIDTIASNNSIDDDLFAAELIRLLNQKEKYHGKTERIKERDAKLIQMRLQDKKQREIAAELNISQSYVSRRVEVVKKMVEEEWGIEVF